MKNADLRLIEEWTGHRQPPRNPMKTIAILSLLLILAVFVLAITGCSGLALNATTPWGDVTTLPDGSATLVPRPIVIPAK